MPPDPVDNLLRIWSVRARFFHSGPLCGDTSAELSGARGHLHVVQRGWADVRHEHLPPLYIAEPTLLFYPRSLPHRFVTDESVGAEFFCATVAFRSGAASQMAQTLPPMLAVPLRDVPEMRSTLDLLFAEASGKAFGKQAVVDRLFEVLVTMLLRRIVTEGLMSSGMLAGLAHPQIGKALNAVHHGPGEPWTIESLARIAGMSRCRFAPAFKNTVGATVGDYLANWRLGVAKALLRQATPVKQVASKVGYGSPVALARVFRARTGLSPRAWLKSEQLGAPLP